MGLKNTLAALMLAVPLGLAHPGPEKVYQHNAVPLEARSLNHCKRHFEKEEFMKRTVEIHGAELSRLRRAAGLEAEDAVPIHKRDYISVSKIDHKSATPVTATTDPFSLFADAGACMLMPAVDQGPLYVKGEEVRKDITEGQAGLKLTLAIQVVDYKTCEVVPDAYVDIWSSNATGMYVGVQGYPGMGDPNDPSILKGTTLRGIQPTDTHGVATFDSLFPGHYSGRATHIHAIVYLGAKKEANNTITGGRAAHVGQIYFDQSLITNVDKNAPYSSNTMKIQVNTGDFLFQQGANGDDPIARYALVGDSFANGMFAWIRFGINTAASKSVNPAAFWTADGGVMNPTGPISQITGGGAFGGFGGFGGFGRKKREAKKAAEKENK